MYVVKRDGRHEPVHFDKITSRIGKLCYGLNTDFVDPVFVSQKVVQGVYKGVSTSELDDLAAETAASLIPEHPDYSHLAARISVSNLHKCTAKDFLQVTMQLYQHVHPKTGKRAPLVSEPYVRFVQANAQQLNSIFVYDRDFLFDYFGFKTLQRSYLLKINGKIVERPQHMWMRVACALHLDNVESAIDTYNLLSQHWYTHASPTLFQAGMPNPQLSSCFLVQIKEDSIDGIYDTLKTCALISKQAGGIGLNVSNVRATGSYIAGTGGRSNGLIPMLRVFNNSSEYVDQGGGKRKGSAAIYLETWHADILEVLDMHRNIGSEGTRCRELYYAVSISDLFMQYVEQDLEWCLFCPNEAPGLVEAWGNGFDALYKSYAAQPHLVRKRLKAREICSAMLRAWTETGMPYVFYKDAANAKSNQQNLGTLTMSNLCAEIIEFTSEDEVAVCNLASISLPMFVHSKKFDFQKLLEVTKAVTYNMNRVIDVTHNPVPEAKRSNERHRPTGIGAQGLADAFLLMGYPFDSPEARKLNIEIYETMYYGACVASNELAKRDGPYSSFAGSPMSRGQFQFDLWGEEGQKLLTGRWDWNALREEIMQHGLRNSLLMASMPTASTSQILGNNECFEPFTSNLYVRRTLAGEFICVSKRLVFSLVERGLWNRSMREKLLAHNGSVQHIDEIPPDLKELHKTAYEIKTKRILDMAADRGAFICQSQSVNVFLNDLDDNLITSMYFYAWKKGLKTIYYVRTQAAVDAIKFTVDPKTEKEARIQNQRKKEEVKEEEVVDIQKKRVRGNSTSEEEEVQKKQKRESFVSNGSDNNHNSDNNHTNSEPTNNNSTEATNDPLSFNCPLRRVSSTHEPPTICEACSA